MRVALHKNNFLAGFVRGTLGRLFATLCLVLATGMLAYAQPANDEPCNAIPLTADVVCNYQVFDNTAATTTVGPPAPGCANFQGNDIWFQVVVPAASNGTLRFDCQAGSLTDVGMAVYRGDCTNLQLLDCDDDGGAGLMPQINLASLTVGSTLWIRVWEYGGDVFGTFGICVKYPGPPPAYDEPCTATALPTPTTDCIYQTFTNETSTVTAGAPAPGCAGFQGGDVWFSVVVPAGGILKFDTQEGEMFDGGMAIYNGPCTALTLIACDDNSSQNGQMPQIVSTTLTPGSTVWIRIWSANTSTGNAGTFGICVSIPPPPPANDEPCNAITLTAFPSCTYQTFTTASATNTAGPPAPGCANFSGGDVWFQVIVPCDGKLDIDTQTGVVTDGGMAAYRGTCTNMQLLDCDDDGSANGLMPRLSLNSLTPGSIIWIRFWEYGNDNPGTFGICVSVPPPTPPGGNCFGAQPFCSSNTYTYPSATNVPSLGSGGIYGCLGSTPNPAWYYMQVQTAGDLDIFLQQNSPAGAGLDVDFVLWGPFPTLPSACNNLSAGNIVDCSYSPAPTETINIVNAQAGDFYVLLITNFSNQPGIVTFNQTSGTATTNCDIVCLLETGDAGPVCGGGTIDLTSTTVPNATYEWVGPNCFTSTQQNPTGVVVPTIPGTYYYIVTATSPGGTACFAVDTVEVIEAPQLGLDSTVNICPGTPFDLTTLYTTTGLTVSWNYGGAPVADSTAVTGLGIYQLIASNATGCNDTVNVNLVPNTVSVLATSTGNATCVLPGEITVSNPVGIAPFEYSIDSNPGVFQSGTTFTADPGSYVITIRDSLGCLATSNVTVDFTNDLTITAATSNASICAGQSATLTATSAATVYSWTPATGLSAPTSQTTLASPTQTTIYTVTGTLGSCVQTADVTVSVDQDFTVDAGGPLSVNLGGSITPNLILTGSNTSLSTILWTPPTGLSSTTTLNPVITPVSATGATTYQVSVTNTNGCVATDELVVNIINDLNCQNVRNAFSPNNDGNNDVWMVYDDYSCLKNVTVTVFNRYGSKVFESRDYRNKWDGRYTDKPIPDGTYYAVVIFTQTNGKIITVKTDLTVIR